MSVEATRTSIRGERGQAASELMLVISVITVAIVAAAYLYVPSFRIAVYDFGEQVELMLESGSIGGLGAKRNDADGGEWGER